MLLHIKTCLYFNLSLEILDWQLLSQSTLKYIPLSSSFHCLVKKSALSLKVIFVMNYLFYAFKIFLTWFDLNLWKTWGLSLKNFFSKEDLQCFFWHLRTMLTQKHSCSPASWTGSQSFRLSSLMGHSPVSLQYRLWIPARVGFASLAIEGLGLGGFRVLFLFCFAPWWFLLLPVSTEKVE